MAMGPFHLEEAVCCPFSKIAAAGIGCIFRMQEGLGAELARFHGLLASYCPQRQVFSQVRGSKKHRLESSVAGVRAPRWVSSVFLRLPLSVEDLLSCVMISHPRAWLLAVLFNKTRKQSNKFQENSKQGACSKMRLK